MFRTRIQTKQRRRQISRREETGLHVSRALPSQTINQEGGCIQHATTLSIGHPHTRSQRVIPAKEESKMKPRPQGGVRLFQIYTESAILGQQPWGRHGEPPVQGGTERCWLCEEFLSGGHEFPLQTAWIRSRVAVWQGKGPHDLVHLNFLSPMLLILSKTLAQRHLLCRLHGFVVTRGSLQMLWWRIHLKIINK